MSGKIGKYFVPFQAIGGTPLKILALGQAAILLAAWVLMPNQVIPSPAEILQAWHRMALNEGMLVELWHSSQTIAIAIFFSTIISFVISLLYTMPFFKAPPRWMTGMRYLGFAGITFLFTMWTSGGVELKIWLLTFGMTVFLLTNMLSLMDDVKQEEIDYAHTLKLSHFGVAYETVVRGRLAESFDLVRQNAAIGWTMLSMVEGLVRSDGGIGSLLISQSRYLHLDAIFAIQLTILVYGILQDYALRWIRDLLCPYAALSTVKG